MLSPFGYDPRQRQYPTQNGPAENEIHVGDGRGIFHMQLLGKNGRHEVEHKQQYRFDNCHEGNGSLKNSLIETARDTPRPDEKGSEWKCTAKSSFSIVTTKDCTPNDSGTWPMA